MVQKVLTLPERTSATQIHVITLPKLKNIKNITSDKGNVTVKSVSGDEVTIELRGATYTRRVQTGGSYTPADTKFVDGQTSANYNSGGYTGTLSQYVYSGSYTEANTQTIEVERSGSLAVYSSNLEAGSTTGEALTAAGLGPTYSYNSNGYTGTLLRRTNSAYASGSNVKVPYAGNVTKPASDTRVYRYQGNVTKPASDTRTYTYYYEYQVTVEYEDNALPTVTLTSPSNNVTLYENDVLSIAGNASDADIGNSVTIRYQINAETTRAIKAFVSTGAAEAFAKQLTFKSGSLYDGETLIAANLTDGVAHTLKVWATDDNGGTSTIVERTFYVVPNRAPNLTVNPPVITGNIDSDTITIDGSYNDADSNNATVAYRINGGNSVQVAQGVSGAFDFDITFGQLKDGVNNIAVEVTDSYGAKTTRTVRLNKTAIAVPQLRSTARYKIEPPQNSAKSVLLWVTRSRNLAIDVALSMTMTGEAENFVPVAASNSAPNTTVAPDAIEDEFYREVDTPVDNIVLQIDMTRASEQDNAVIYLLQGVLE